jgi:hypothetical protein
MPCRTPNCSRAHWPDCAVCADGYARLLGYTCQSCSQGQAGLIAGVVLTALAVLLVVLGVTVWLATADAPPLGASSRLQPASLGPPMPAAASRWCERAGPVLLSLLRRLRIPLVVLQLLGQFCSLTGAQFPPLYQ